MDIEKLIKDTFAEHEHVVPEHDEVLAATRQRIDRRRTVLSRPLAVAAGVAVLTLAAVTVVAVNRSGPSQAAAPGDEVQATAPVSTAATEPAIADLTMPYSLGWLPSGEVDYLGRGINIGSTAESPDVPLYGGEYLLTVTVDGQVLTVDVHQLRMMPVDEAAFKSGPGSPVTINGQRGVESANSDGPGGYELYVTHPDGGSMYVGVAAQHGSTAPAQQLVDIGRRIAQNIRFPGTTTVTPAFGLRDLPEGMRICAFNVDKPVGGSEPNTRYALGECSTTPPIKVNTAVPGAPRGIPGRPVQGRETRYSDESGYRVLSVLDAVGGEPVIVAGSVPPADLYDIADRLVLPD